MNAAAIVEAVCQQLPYMAPPPLSAQPLGERWGCQLHLPALVYAFYVGWHHSGVAVAADASTPGVNSKASTAAATWAKKLM